ncbi:peptidase S41 family protein [Colletotrichum graminicola]|uniref:Peptidase S41 family protein n=1 Tax=Colletotrichum graminicola (strain M1.001 / M2 / FGSC 10212) TaxID=645133 RepID=E3QKA4_COLGM|nr:peptidase S41 family protein [Colletotrichum graminicola M1.001]EFQ31292.1 peptidase S41 family protein [Colletotrichum graminicola M1.001]WDK19302.1 peptidase S41 family protein [Colletotrichum graminicola]
MRFTLWPLAAAAAVLAVPAPQQFPPTRTSSTTGTPTASTSPSGTAPGGSNNACAQIRPKMQEFRQANPKEPPQVPAQLAFDCLQTVPNKPGPAKDLIKSLKAYVQWQSTLSWLKSPPASYMLPPVDIEGGLDEIGSKAEAGQYKSEYDFQLAIFKLIASAHDGHFAFRGDVFKGFSFRNRLAADIVSVSRDGVEIPKLYHLSQINDTAAPAIVKINGRDAVTAIGDINLKFSGFQDPDSQWNSNFKSYASSQGFLVVAASLAFQGSKVTLTYDNGDERSEDSFALIRPGANFTGVNSGDDYYSRFCDPDNAPKAPSLPPGMMPNQTNPRPNRPDLPPPPPTIEGFPFPIVRDSGANTTSGYFLNGTGYDDVAVLSVLSFASPDPSAIDAIEYLTNFQSTVAEFLAKSKEAGKKRLVIDVAANGGGFVIAGYELFAQLFPEVDRFQANNMRLAEGLVSLARLTDGIPANFTPTSADERDAIQDLIGSSIVSNLIPGGVFTPDGKAFTTVDQILAPVTLNGDSFTAYQQAPLNQTDPTFNLTGVGSRSNPPGRVFDPENVVIFTDGTCGSTCTIFSYLMILQMGVKTTVIGGRPTTGIMQSVAGVEGAQVFSFNDMTADARAILDLTPKERREELMSGELGELAKGYAIKRATTPRSAGAINAKNAFSMSDARTPLQFLWEPANCRIFHTRESLFQPEVAWKRVVDATWHNPMQFCVAGSQTPVKKDVTMDPLFKQSQNNTGLPSAAPEGVSAAGLRLAVLLTVLTAAVLSL